MKKTIAFFDFDGTITRKDTMLELIRFAKGNAIFYSGLLRLLPWLMAMKMKFIKNETAKEKMLSLFFKGMSLENFHSICQSFTKKKITSLIRSDAMEAIAFHKSNKHDVVVVTASAENWVKPWCDEQSIKILGTHLEVDSKNCITGKLKSINCNGDEKVNRIKAEYNLAEYDEIYSYGDSKGDMQMLKLATHPFYRHFKG